MKGIIAADDSELINAAEVGTWVALAHGNRRNAHRSSAEVAVDKSPKLVTFIVATVYF